jgi:hypothetical protein
MEEVPPMRLGADEAFSVGGEDNDSSVVGLNPLMGIDRQHESREARSLYLSALQLTCALRLEVV